MPTFVVIAVRAAASYIVLLVLARLMGKRGISEMTYFDYIVGITIGALTGSMATQIESSWFDILPAVLVYGIFQIIISFASLKSAVFRQLVEGSSTALINKGKVIKENLRKERMNLDELAGKIREKNAFSFADVETAILEPDGEISVQLKPDKQPVTKADLKLKIQSEGLPMLVIRDGIVYSDDLKDAGITCSWLMTKLAEQGIGSASQVMLAQVDTQGNLYVDLYSEFENNSKNTDPKFER